MPRYYGTRNWCVGCRCGRGGSAAHVRLQFAASEAEAAAYSAEEEQAAAGVAQVETQSVDGLRLRAPALGKDLFERAERNGLRPLVLLHEVVDVDVVVGPGVAAVGEYGDFLGAEGVEVGADVGGVALEVGVLKLAVLGEAYGEAHDADVDASVAGEVEGVEADGLELLVDKDVDDAGDGAEASPACALTGDAGFAAIDDPDVADDFAEGKDARLAVALALLVDVDGEGFGDVEGGVGEEPAVGEA